MASLDRKTVEKIAQLAHLKLSEEELLHYEKQLSVILDYMQVIQQAQVKLPEGWRSDTEQMNLSERVDQAEHSQVMEKVLKCAPKTVGTAFQVPRILE